MAKKVEILTRNHARRGSAAVVALVSLSLLVCMGTVLARLMKIEADATQNFREGIAAQSIAEAGLRRAIVVLYNNGNPHGLAETIRRQSLSVSTGCQPAPKPVCCGSDRSAMSGLPGGLRPYWSG